MQLPLLFTSPTAKAQNNARQALWAIQRQRLARQEAERLMQAQARPR